MLTVQSTGLEGSTSTSKSSSRPSMGSFLFAAAERFLCGRNTIKIVLWSNWITVIRSRKSLDCRVDLHKVHMLQ